jgi:CRISPR system Cascade subunit CasE
MTLHLLHLPPDPVALAAWATRHGLLSPDGDHGYALHALLAAAFDGAAPQPFRYLGGAQGLLAYTATAPERLREAAALAPPDIAKALGLEALTTRPFPSQWHGGHRLGFEVRLRPVIRAKDGRERDAFLHAIETTPTDEAPDDGRSHLAKREQIYLQWLARQLEATGAARLEPDSVRMEAFRLTRVLRKGRAKEDGRRPGGAFTGPDALIKGDLRVTDGPAFAELLARGIGRHRAFGFGMLLLRPAAPC